MLHSSFSMCPLFLDKPHNASGFVRDSGAFLSTAFSRAQLVLLQKTGRNVHICASICRGEIEKWLSIMQLHRDWVSPDDSIKEFSKTLLYRWTVVHNYVTYDGMWLTKVKRSYELESLIGGHRWLYSHVLSTAKTFLISSSSARWRESALMPPTIPSTVNSTPAASQYLGKTRHVYSTVLACFFTVGSIFWR